MTPEGPPSTRSPRSETVVSGERLEVRQAGRRVWTEADFQIARGEFVAVIGPNGAGKTTLFRLLLGLTRPSHGTVRLFGEAPRRGSPRIGYVPQRHTIDNETHVASFELVRLGFSGHRWGVPLHPRREREAAWRALEAVGALDLAEKPLSDLSGGERQRIFLAEALVGDPELLLLDEPLASLDLRRTRELVEVVHRLVTTRGVTCLLVAHDINPLIPCLDKVIYLANGRVATGAPDEVLTSASLSALYGVPIEVLRDSRGNLVIVGGEERHGGEDT